MASITSKSKGAFMNGSHTAKVFSKDTKYLLALHSSTDTLGLGLIQIDQSEVIFKSSTYKVSRDLSNYLFNFVQDLLPAKLWHKIIRLAVATGPGGYTGTRTTVVFARTLAQQLKCDIDGISSFELMAYRVASNSFNKHKEKTFWITKELKRRGIVAGKYKVINSNKENNNIVVKELESPHLLQIDKKIYPTFNFSEDIENDINRLLKISLDSYQIQNKNSWEYILPIYPTSPINLRR